MNIGIIGTGARSVCYLQLLLENERFKDHRIVALCDVDEERLKAYSNHFFPQRQIVCYTDYKKMFEDGLTEAVLITTPDFAHKEIALAAMEAGQHILLEKPIECEMERATEIYQVAKNYDRTLMMGFVLRYVSVYERVRQILQSGQLGEIVSVQAAEKLDKIHSSSFMRRWHRFSKYSGGMMNTKCCHDMDILRYLIGSDVESVVAYGGCRFYKEIDGAAEHCCGCALKDTCTYSFDYTDYDSPTRFSCVEDICVYNCEKDVVDHEVMLLNYKNGVKAQFELCMFSGEENRKMVIHGTKATLEMDFERRTIRIVPLKDRNLASVEEIPAGDSGHGGGDEILLAAFLDSACNGPTVNNVADGLVATATALAAEKSMKEKRLVSISEMI